jgi:hypothetical protein
MQRLRLTAAAGLIEAFGAAALPQSGVILSLAYSWLFRIVPRFGAESTRKLSGGERTAINPNTR